MALSTYTELQQTVADFMHRSDLSVVIPTFIYLAESKISNNIRSRRLETTATLTTTVGDDYVNLPNDYTSMKNITVSNSPNSVLTMLPDDTLLNYNANGTQGIPKFYSISANTIKLSPIPDSEYSIQLNYYQDLPGLSSTNQTNWMLTYYPYVYLYGALIEACVYVNDPEQVEFFTAKFNDAIEDIWQNYGYESFGGSPLRAVSDYVI